MFQSLNFKLAVRTPKIIVLVFSLLILPAQSPLVSDLKLIELAESLAMVSRELVEAKSQSGDFDRVAQRASKLEREVKTLTESMTRSRNLESIAARFSEVSKRYTALEKAYWRDDRQEIDADVLDHLAVISKHYADLGTAFYQSRHYRNAPELVIFAAPSLVPEGVRAAPFLILEPTQ